MNYFALPELKKKNIEVRFPGCSKKEIIIGIVCEWFDVTREQLSKKCRKREFVVPRQISMYFLKEYTTMSHKEIGIIFGGRDHTTSIHSINQVRDLMDCYQEFANDIKAMESKIIDKLFGDSHTSLITYTGTD